MHHQPHVTLVNGAETSALSIFDRGLAYGDGIFETMRVVDGEIPLVHYHLERFRRGVEILDLGHAKGLEHDFNAYIEQALDGLSGKALVKLIVTRGTGGRGYQVPPNAHPTFIVEVFDLPTYDTANYEDGVAVKLCDYVLPHNPVLAGIKHLNRLDQVIASQELDEEEEGLVCDSEGNVIEGLKSNLIVFEQNRVLTPELDRCGVRGSLRQYLMSQSSRLGFEIQEARISKEQLMDAQGLALVNSIFGCWSVSKIDAQAFSNDPRCGTIQHLLAEEMAYPSVSE